MDSTSEPLAKRRKLSRHDSDIFVEDERILVSLARTSLDVELVDEVITRTLEEPLESKPVILESAVIHGNALIIGLHFSGRKDLLHLKSLSPHLEAYDIGVVENSLKLESIWKPAKHITFYPVACTRARLSQPNATTDNLRLGLEVEILWRNTERALEKIPQAALEVLQIYQPEEDVTDCPPDHPKWTPRDFYDNVHVPTNDSRTSADIKVDLLQCQLYPFQRRAVRWLLQKEGVEVEESGRISSLRQTHDGDQIPNCFQRRSDAAGHPVYVSHALGVVSRDLEMIRRKYGGIRGGILAEEMGLGKTVELIALICLHLRPTSTIYLDEFGRRKSGATLIITPPPILEQWKQELREHAPSLKVYHYDSMRANERRRLGSDFLGLLASQDVVLTTYNVISKEIHYTKEKSERNLRNTPRFEIPKSPLTQLSWWRVCLDEAQMVESGVSNAAQVARLIPRVNAWAVSGTPLKRNHKDLYGLLLFLQFEPWSLSVGLWNRVLSQHKSLFKNMLQATTIRHSKDFVREDLRLPPQTRHTVTVPFTAIEEQNYAQLFHQMCEECGVGRDGAPTSDNWDPNSSLVIEKMRTWLTRLRQTCLHPEVGGRNRRALGRRAGPLRSVLQVLDVMIDQNDTNVRNEQRLMLISRIRRGQMLENASQKQGALKLWGEAYEESSRIVRECRDQLAEELGRQQKSTNSDAKQEPVDSDDEVDADPVLTSYRQRLRSALEVKHICIFFLGNVYFQMKSDESVVQSGSQEYAAWERKEEACYEEAKTIRAELLAEVLRKANRYIEDVRTRDAKKSLVVIPTMGLSSSYSGVESRKVFEKLDDYCGAMNRQRDQLVLLRERMVGFLRQSLLDEDETVELQGDEYEASTKHQDEMYACMEALRALYADRSDALTGQTNTLIAHEMKLAQRAAKANEGPAPEILLELLEERKQGSVPKELGSLRGAISEIRHLITALQWQEGNGSSRARLELAIANQILQNAQQISAEQNKIITALQQEVNLFRDTMNSRLDYYRALQKISDTVRPYEEEKQGQPLDLIAFGRMLTEEAVRQTKISNLLSKRRYLEHLRHEQDSSTPSQRLCTICQGDFENGTLTICGHQFCKECIGLWWHSHQTCPVCKRMLKYSEFYDITYKPAEIAIQEEAASAVTYSQSSPGSSSKEIYSDIPSTVLNQIKNIDLTGSYYGTKVDTMCRHLYWLRQHDPGSKVIVFSQYPEFLQVLRRAFDEHKISYTEFGSSTGLEKFKSDPAVECFLLHAKAHSSGLNLVVASHIFLCEPLINTAIELQAIARVHRIGQHRPTTVWMYLIADSVEESIYDISVARRLAHMRRKVYSHSSGSGSATPAAIMESTIDAANSMELQAADISKMLTSGKSGGELVDNKDLWKCLFGRVKKRDVGWSEAAEAEAQDANSNIGRFLRGEAAEERTAWLDHIRAQR